MTTEAELVQQVSNSSKVIKLTFLEEHPSRDGGVDRFYAILVGNPDTPTLGRYESFCIRVYNKGTANENAYFRDSIPSPLMQFPTNTSTFGSDLRDFINQRKSQLTNVVKITVDFVDEASEIATVTAWKLTTDTTAITKEQYVVWRENGTFNIKRYSTS